MTTDKTEPLLKFSQVEKRFGDAVAVRDMDLEIGRGDFVAIMGPSGCGKTTTLRMLAGLETPSAGTIFYDGTPIDDVPPWKREMPLVWQNYALFPFLSVIDNVCFGLRERKVPKAERRERARKWLDRLGIGAMADRMPNTLSGGQAQRVALARALVLEPEILILDEPLSALDAHMVVRMQTELAELQKALGITFVYVTHNQSEAFAMANHVVIMNEGRIEQVGSPLDIYRAPKTRFVANFVGTNNILDGTIADKTDGTWNVETPVGHFTSTNPTDEELSHGQKVHLVVSADMMAVADGKEESGPNRIDAVLIGESFAGNVVTLVFETGTGQELRVQVQERALRGMRLTAQDHVTLTFDPAEALLIPAH